MIAHALLLDLSETVKKTKLVSLMTGANFDPVVVALGVDGDLVCVTPNGPPETWPDQLRDTVGLLHPLAVAACTDSYTTMNPDIDTHGLPLSILHMMGHPDVVECITIVATDRLGVSMLVAPYEVEGTTLAWLEEKQIDVGGSVQVGGNVLDALEAVFTHPAPTGNVLDVAAAARRLGMMVGGQQLATRRPHDGELCPCGSGNAATACHWAP